MPLKGSFNLNSNQLYYKNAELWKGCLFILFDNMQEDAYDVRTKVDLVQHPLPLSQPESLKSLLCR